MIGKNRLQDLQNEIQDDLYIADDGLTDLLYSLDNDETLAKDDIKSLIDDVRYYIGMAYIHTKKEFKRYFIGCKVKTTEKGVFQNKVLQEIDRYECSEQEAKVELEKFVNDSLITMPNSVSWILLENSYLYGKYQGEKVVKEIKIRKKK